MTAGDIVGEPLYVHGVASGSKERHEQVAALFDRVGLRAGADGQLSAPVLGRPAPAHRHRPRARARAQADRRRRAGVGARRLDPGAGHQPAAGPAARAAAVLPVHLAQSRGGRAHQPPHRRDVSRPHRRVRRHALDLHASRSIPIPRRCCRRCRCPIRPSSARSACCRATCRARSIRRRAATSTPAAPMPWPAARSRRLCCAKLRRGITFPAICAKLVAGAVRALSA